MSKNRENVIWQSEDGTWNRGFYDFYYINEDDDDFDDEWDVEYTDDFGWVSLGHATEEAAYESWDGCNPGGYTVMAFTPENAKWIAECERKAAEHISSGGKNQRLVPSHQRAWFG
jgi:hypothetical protein